MSKTICIAAVLMLNIVFPLAHANEDCAPVADVDDFYTTGWGYTKSNERYQSRTTINKSNVDQLTLKWSFLLEGGMSPHSFPVVTEDTIFAGTQAGKLHAIDRATGCVRWTYDAGNDIRSALTHGTLPDAAGGETYLFFGTNDGHAHAVDAATGKPRWVTNVSEHSRTILTGAPVYHDGRLYVPISSMELVLAVLPWYGCCTFRGSIVALDAASGEVDWRTYMVLEEPEITTTHFLFVQKHGPSGAPIWNAPVIDAGRGSIYVGTGENYSTPATDMSDAIIALDIKTGAVKWSQQYLANDAFNVGCAIKGHPNCPDEDGPDLDFGAPPILTQTSDGEAMIVAGQKSGGVYGLRPDTGERVWERFFGRGGLLGGIHWGMAVNPQTGVLFVPINDMQLFYKITEGPSKPALHALDIGTGEVRWTTPMEDTCGDRTPCNPGLSAAIATTPDLVFAGGLDGYMRAFDQDTGAIVWSFDTWGNYETANGKQASGGTIDVHGPLIAGNMMFVQSGYGAQALQGGNALLAFELKESNQ